MENYSTLDFHGEFKGTMTSRSGKPKSTVSGTANPAFRISESDRIPSGSLTGSLGANNSAYRHVVDENESAKIFDNAYNNSSTNSGRHKMYATIRQPSIIGYTLRGVSVNDGLNNSMTLSRNYVPIIIERANNLNAIHVPIISRHYKRPDIRASISYFDIEIDKVPRYQYRPGEDITGTVTLLVRKSLEIRFVELIVVGQGQIRIIKPENGVIYSVLETYMHKEKCIIGAYEGMLISLLTSGRYSSKFRIKLPPDLPSAIHYEDSVTGLLFDVKYTIRVRVCDDPYIVPTFGHSSASDSMVRVLMEKQVHFNVQRGFDICNIPTAMAPVIHTEQVQLACNDQQTAIVSIHLDRSVFLAGDEIRLRIRVSLPSSQTVKEIRCKLQELVHIDFNHEPIVFTLSKIIRKDPSPTGDNFANQKTEQTVFDVTIPTNTGLLSPYALGNSRLKVEYFLEIKLRFTPAGGKLYFKVPIGMGPCAESIYVEKTLSKKILPVFNKPTRFPCFSTRTLTGSGVLHPSDPRNTQAVQVTTKYSNGLLARCYLCCMCSENL